MEERRKTGSRPLRRKILYGLFALVLVLGVYLAILLVTEDTGIMPPPAASRVQASPPMQAASQQELIAMVDAFPGAVLAAKENEGLTLLGAESHDTAWQGGLARVAEAVYADSQGRQLRLFSFYPSGAIALLGTAGWQMSAAKGPDVSGSTSALMKRGRETRLVMSHGAGAYAVLIPEGLDPEEAVLPLQLYSSKEE